MARTKHVAKPRRKKRSSGRVEPFNTVLCPKFERRGSIRRRSINTVSPRETFSVTGKMPGTEKAVEESQNPRQNLCAVANTPNVTECLETTSGVNVSSYSCVDACIEQTEQEVKSGVNGKPVTVTRGDSTEYRSSVRTGYHTQWSQQDSHTVGSTSHGGPFNTVLSSQKAAGAHRSPVRGVCGLVNLGNTCFMNSALQCLSNTDELRNFFIGQSPLNHQHKNKKTSNSTSTDRILVESFSNLLREMWRGEKSAINPGAFKKRIGVFAPRFSGYSQEDSQEFLTFLLDGLHQGVNVATGLTPELSKILETIEGASEEKKMANEAWVELLMDNNSVIVQLCQVQLRSLLRCGNTECQKARTFFDSCRFLSVPLPDGGVTGYHKGKKTCTLEDCLSLMTEGKPSKRKNWRCPHCKMLVHLINKTDIWRAPEILIIYLKRFRSLPYRKYKLCTAVDFPITNLDLSPHISNPEEKCQYDLYATINHEGTIDCGHYTAYAKNDETWYFFNDSFTKPLSQSSEVKTGVQASTAYVLFYKKRSKPFCEQAPAKDHHFQSSPCHDSAGSSVDVGSCVDVDKHTSGEPSLKGSTDTSVTQRYSLHSSKGKLSIAISPSQSSRDVECGVRSDDTPTESAVKQKITSSHSRSICDVESDIDAHLDKVQTGVRKSDDYEVPSETKISRPVLKRHFAATMQPGLCCLEICDDTNCCLNAVLQCLSNTGCLREYFVGETSPFHQKNLQQLLHSRYLANSLFRLLQDMWGGQHRRVKTDELMKNLGEYITSSSDNPHTVLTRILERLDKDLKDVPGCESESTIISNLFSGQERSDIKCDNNCSDVNTSVLQEFRVLTVPIPNGTFKCSTDHLLSIDDCLKHMFCSNNDEEIGSSKWKCLHCQGPAKLFGKIVKAPEILVLYLAGRKRNEHEVDMQVQIQFPLEDLDISSYVAGKETKHVYDLYAIIARSSSGHLTACAKNQRRWYVFFEENVFAIKRPCDCDSEVPEVLFYKRKKREALAKLRSKVDILPSKVPIASKTRHCKGTREETSVTSNTHESHIEPITISNPQDSSITSTQTASSSEQHRCNDDSEAMEITSSFEREPEVCSSSGEPGCSGDICTSQETTSHEKGLKSRKSLCVTLGLCGLSDDGFSSCYVISTLQCLLHTAPLQGYFMGSSPGYEQDLNKGNPNGTGGKLAKSFSKLLQSMCDGTHLTQDISVFKRVLTNIAPGIFDKTSKDPVHLLTTLLNGLHEDLIRDDILDSVFVAGQQLFNIPKTCENRLKSKIAEIFHGCFNTYNRCTNCSFISQHVAPDAFQYLPLPPIDDSTVQNPSIENRLKVSLQKFCCTSQEYCQQCNTFTEHISETGIWRTPQVLVIHLDNTECKTKPFQEHNYIQNCSLDISSLLHIDNEELCQYDLYATINLNSSGHYYSIVKHSEKWYLLDTHSHQVMELTTLRKFPSTYVLFYEKRLLEADKQSHSTQGRSGADIEQHYWSSDQNSTPSLEQPDSSKPAESAAGSTPDHEMMDTSQNESSGNIF